MCWGLFFFKQKTAYEVRISDWSSDVCSSDLHSSGSLGRKARTARRASRSRAPQLLPVARIHIALSAIKPASLAPVASAACIFNAASGLLRRSEEHTSELQSLMRISYALFCLKKKKTHTTHILDKS